MGTVLQKKIGDEANQQVDNTLEALSVLVEDLFELCFRAGTPQTHYIICTPLYDAIQQVLLDQILATVLEETSKKDDEEYLGAFQAA